MFRAAATENGRESPFPEDRRHPTDEDILQTREKDDADLKQLDSDVQKLFDDFKSLNEGGKVQGSRLTDYLQHRVEPLMARAAEIGDLPSAPAVSPRSESHHRLSYEPQEICWS